MPSERKTQGFGRNERIAVTVAAYPAADFEDIRNADAGIGRLKIAFHRTVEFRQGFKEAHWEDGYTVVNFVVDTKFVAARFAGLPQAQKDSVDFAGATEPVASGLVQRSRCGSSARMRRLKLKTVWRCTSVGCAVKRR